MAVKLIERLHTTRTNPRLMKSNVDGHFIMTLHDHFATSGLVWLDGPNAGKVVTGSCIDWTKFDDTIGSVTLHNAD